MTAANTSILPFLSNKVFLSAEVVNRLCDWPQRQAKQARTISLERSDGFSVLRFSVRSVRSSADQNGQYSVRACVRAWGKATVRLMGRNSLNIKVDQICALHVAGIMAQDILTSI